MPTPDRAATQAAIDREHIEKRRAIATVEARWTATATAYNELHPTPTPTPFVYRVDGIPVTVEEGRVCMTEFHFLDLDCVRAMRRRVK